MIIFESVLTTFESSVVFGVSKGSSENWLTLKPNHNKQIRETFCMYLCRRELRESGISGNA